jgi:hypothetical protein
VARLWLGGAQASIDDLSIGIDASTTPDSITAWAYLSVLPAATDRAQIEAWIADLS